MINYNNGKIYKIEAINGDEGDIYIGSTTKKLLSQRMSHHRFVYKKASIENGVQNYRSHKIFDKYGVDNCQITLLEIVNASSKDDLLSRESYYIRNLQCVNKVIPNRTIKEYCQDNIVKIKENQKKWRKDNKDKIIEMSKIYNEINKERISERDKIKFTCECGSICRSRGRSSRHNKTKKHINYLNSLIL
jgi:hypothetical protein